MTDVKSVDNAGLALFATKPYKAGEVILQETPLIVFAPKNADQIVAVRSQFQNISASKKVPGEMSAINDLSIPSSIGDSQKNEFRGMLLAAASYALEEEDAVKAKVQKLYAPQTNCNEHEKKVVALSDDAISFLKRQAQKQTKLYSLVHDSTEECKKVMLIWSCNAFKGGRIYEMTSRINHSCDFNAVVSIDVFSRNQDEQIIRAASDIPEGEEINISYLGSITYADYKLRNERLNKEKFFSCKCERCEKDRSSGDIAGCIPCPKCHPRDGRYLDEDIQYDDGEVEVQYCLPRSKAGGDGTGITYKCIKCGEISLEEKISDAVDKAIERSISHLDSGLAGKSEIDDDVSERENKIELTERLTCLATSVLGAKHWATNLLTFIMLSTKLSSLHATMLCKSRKDGDSSKLEDEEEQEERMSDIAECIDSLERVTKYISSLNLKSHVGHLVGNVSVGVARVLVGFGDVKSMQYGSTFVSLVFDDFFKLGFEGEGMEKVAETLMTAWKRKAEEDNNNSRQKKRQKL